MPSSDGGGITPPPPLKIMQAFMQWLKV
jgi:hypothetical protein